MNIAVSRARYSAPFAFSALSGAGLYEQYNDNRWGSVSGSIDRSTIDEVDRDIRYKARKAAAWAKERSNQFAVFLPTAHRHRLFRQLDSLHDVDEWDEGDQPLRRDSFVTFLRTIMALRPQRWPGLGMTPDGYLLASWGGAVDHVSVQFLADDQVRWSLTRERAEEPLEHAAGINSALELRRFLEPYEPDHWFNAG